jgi:hypothetical protein
VKPKLKHSHQAIWLLSTPEFRLKAFTDRGTLWDIPNRTSDPEKALQNQLERENLFTEYLLQEVKKEGVKEIIVDGSFSESELVNKVDSYFKISNQNND